jgi:hypothetical protein
VYDLSSNHENGVFGLSFWAPWYNSVSKMSILFSL